MTQSQFQGCLIGLALGDAMCAPYEGGCLERSLWRIIGKTKEGKARFTDDTQMAMDMASSLLANRGVNQDHLAHTFAKNYHWSRGYGPSASKILKKIRAGHHWSKVNTLRHPQGSFGNGAAMRCPPIALFYAKHPDQRTKAVTQASVITHAHVLGIEGAQLVAQIVHASLHTGEQEHSVIEIAKAGLKVCESDRFISQMYQVIAWLEPMNTESDTCRVSAHQHSTSAKEVRQVLGNGMAATTSCATAVYVGLAFSDRPFSALLDFVRQVGGDTDTIAAMAGAIWGCNHGVEAFEQGMIEQLEKSQNLLKLGKALYDASQQYGDFPL